MAMHVDWLTVS